MKLSHLGSKSFLPVIEKYEDIEMSETVHYKGKLKPTGKTVSEYVKEKCSEIPEYYNDEKEYFNDTFYNAAVEVSGQVYEVEKEDVDSDYDIFIAIKNDDGSISFEVMYYNGACSFDEAIDQAIKVIR